MFTSYGGSLTFPILTQIHNTTVHVITNIDRSAHHKPRITALSEGIQQFHYFIFVNNDTILTAPKACADTCTSHVTQRLELVGTKKRSKYTYVWADGDTKVHVTVRNRSV